MRKRIGERAVRPQSQAYLDAAMPRLVCKSLSVGMVTFE